ncbi:MAG: HesA/MoeB/ThiF family protein [Anaerolineae bacterium]
MAYSAESLDAVLQKLARVQGDLRLIDLASVREISRQFGVSVKEVELAALRRRIMPARYQRSLGTVGWEGQIRLLESTAAVVGAGGLGGWIIEGLARMGVGHLIVIDGDVFEENNLNRQAFSREDLLGKSKAEAACRRVQEVNRAVEVTAHHAWLTEENAESLLQGAEVVVDALDKLPVRIMLQDVCARLGVPMVHGAIGGYIGQVTTVFPGDPGLRALYGNGPVPERGAEVEWGNPAGTPMMVAAWEIQETVKLLTGHGTPLRRRLLFMDAESGTVECFQLG